jgi:L-alanine-DL-glutamate epimerase-like enolase superfamily enzyme
MRLVSCELRHVRWRLDGAEGNASGVPELWRAAAERAGTLVRISDDEGQYGIGEASPLPVTPAGADEPGEEAAAPDDRGAASAAYASARNVSPSRTVAPSDSFGHYEPGEPGQPIEIFEYAERSGRTARLDTAELAAAALVRFSRYVLARRPLPEEAFAFAAELGSPAAQFAVETALYSGMARRRGSSLADVLRAFPAPPSRVPVNAVVTSVASARAAFARGITTFKVKLGDDAAADLAFLRELRAAFGDAIHLRGDANQRWPSDLAEVSRRLTQLRPAGLLYLEEPCRDLTISIAAANASGQPIALDESVLGLPLAKLERALAEPRVAALIVKPSRLGLYGSMVRSWIAKGRHKPVVVTHALEGPVAMAACAELARALAADQPGLAVGLDAHPGLGAWPVAAPQLAAIDRGELIAASAVNAGAPLGEALGLAAGLGLEDRWRELSP